MPTYFLQDASGYIGLLEHESSDLVAGDVVVLEDGREALVTARIGGARGSRFVAVLEVIVASSSDDQV